MQEIYRDNKHVVTTVGDFALLENTQKSTSWLFQGERAWEIMLIAMGDPREARVKLDEYDHLLEPVNKYDHVNGVNERRQTA